MRHKVGHDFWHQLRHLLSHIVGHGYALLYALEHDRHHLGHHQREQFGEENGEHRLHQIQCPGDFAHEMHHIGYRNLSKNIRGQLRLDEMEGRAFEFISGLVAEGSATYLINGHCDINLIKSHRRYIRYFELEKDLREICEGILRSILDGHIVNDDDYSKATKQLLGMGYHAAGSMIMHVIHQANGLEHIMRVLQDPRLLLIEYNKAAGDLMAESESTSIYLFDEELVKAVTDIGQ